MNETNSAPTVEFSEIFVSYETKGCQFMLGCNTRPYEL